MTDENKEKIELTPAEESPWGNFLLKTIELDETNKTVEGWHWFFGLYYLYNKLTTFRNFNFTSLKNALPDGNWLKEIDDVAMQEIDINIDEIGLLPLVNDLLNSTDITSTIDFSALSFDKSIDFSRFIFPVDVSFEHTKFYDEVIFNLTMFYENANFNKTIFYKQTFFNGTKFFKLINFIDVRFFGELSFVNAVLKITSFQNTKFYHFANFSKATFSEVVMFNNATFFHFSFFNGVTFAERVSFSDVKFKKSVPHFYDSKFHSDITWERDIKLWPQIKKYTKKHNSIEHTNQTADQNAYENLAYHMKVAEKHHDEHFFFRQEMRCRRNLGSIFNSLIYGFYEYLADYGYGVGRAFSWWLGHILIGALALFGFRYFYGINDFINDAGCALGVSLANSHGFFFMGDRLDNCYMVFKNVPFFTAIWATQTVFGIALLFLVLLTLRVRFRLK